ncbi:MAG: hypothetical protein PHY81_05715 [Candidatus Bipolaricaulis anaerobius]|nr:hypothetical protein [Candidatus Bipolaricaulis anaerobius]HQM38495.1 hypothetical protein [Candidatus Bipolaricaulis anaerobius]
MRRISLIAFALGCLALPSWGWAVQTDAFLCSGEERGEECWLSDARLTDTATWHVSNVPPGAALPLVLEGVADDLCATCQAARDVLVRLYYRSPGDPYWQRAELWLRATPPASAQCLVGYPVRGETRIFPTSSELVIVAQRVLGCDPHVGFSWGSLTFGAAPVAATPIPLPTLPTPPPPPEPPPPTPEPTCLAGPGFLCSPGDPPAECLLPGLDLSSVARQDLPESYGPGEEDAVLLQPGHYSGTLGEGDYQDWYRIQASYGDAFLVWVDPGSLVVDLHLVHDPCGDVLAQCLDVSSPSTIRVPCYPGVDCKSLGECFLDGVCKLFIRIVRREGSGEYKLSILEAEPETPPL